jgi:hypothetical protein
VAAKEVFAADAMAIAAWRCSTARPHLQAPLGRLRQQAER